MDVERLIRSIEKVMKPGTERCQYKYYGKYHMVYRLRDGELLALLKKLDENNLTVIAINIRDEKHEVIFKEN